MCLANVGPRKIAEKDIVCYKFIKRWEGKYIKPFQEVTVNIGKTYRSRILRLVYDWSKIDVALHSFTSKASVRAICKNYEHEIVKCIIPRGAHYYKGIFLYREHKYPSYASNLIKYVEIVE